MIKFCIVILIAGMAAFAYIRLKDISGQYEKESAEAREMVMPKKQKVIGYKKITELEIEFDEGYKDEYEKCMERKYYASCVQNRLDKKTEFMKSHGIERCASGIFGDKQKCW